MLFLDLHLSDLDLDLPIYGDEDSIHGSNDSENSPLPLDVKNQRNMQTTDELLTSTNSIKPAPVLSLGVH